MVAGVVTRKVRGARETTYLGFRDEAGEANVIVVNIGCIAVSLNPRLDQVNHSPDGFEWGYEGSGPAQLAFAMLTHATGTDTARKYYQEFKTAKIAALSRNKDAVWEMPKAAVIAWLKERGWKDGDDT